MAQIDGEAAFGDRAEEYARYRPSYPSRAVDAILDGLGAQQSVKALDVGAGTGIGTKLLAERGVSVIALEPNDAMRAFAAEAGLKTVAASARSTGFPENAFHLVTVFQAFHWFGDDAALAEFGRILRRNGRLALVWNSRDESDATTRSYGEAFECAGEKRNAAALAHDPDVLGLLRRNAWRDVRVVSAANPWQLTLDGLIGYARSASYYPKTRSAAEAVDERLRVWFDQYGKGGQVTLRFITQVYVATRPCRDG